MHDIFCTRQSTLPSAVPWKECVVLQEHTKHLETILGRVRYETLRRTRRIICVAWRSSYGGAVYPKKEMGGFQLGKVKRPVEWTDENVVNKWEKQGGVIDPTERYEATGKRKTLNKLWPLVRTEGLKKITTWCTMFTSGIKSCTSIFESF